MWNLVLQTIKPASPVIASSLLSVLIVDFAGINIVSMVLLLLCTTGFSALSVRIYHLRIKRLEMEKYKSSQLGEMVEKLTEIHTTSLDKDYNLIKQEFHQIQALSSDAVGRLQDSFNRLNSCIFSQQQLMEMLSVRLTGVKIVPGDHLQTDKTDIAMGRNDGDVLNAMTNKSLAGLEYINNMIAQMDNIFNILGEVESIANKTCLVAINASIESARVNEHGRGFAVVANEIKQLSQKSSDFQDKLRRQIDSTRKSMESAQSLIKDMSNDLGLLNAFITETLEKVDKASHETNLNVKLTVQSLQFDDIITQLTNSTLNYLEVAYKDNTRFRSSVRKYFDGDCVSFNKLSKLQKVIAAYSRQRIELSEKFVKTVSQDNLAAGNIELF